MKLLFLLFDFIFLPFYVFGFFVPKKSNVWVFGSLNGVKYGENSRALFEYVRNKELSIRAVWLTKNEHIVDPIKGIYHFYSLDGFYYSLIGKNYIISNSFFDVPWFCYLFPFRIKIIQLWHGTPLKRLISTSNSQGFILKVFLHYIKRHSDLIISATDKNLEIYNSLGHNRVITTGQPRNDRLLNYYDGKSRNILYLPTWREGDSDFDFFSRYKFDLKRFDEFLEGNQAKLYIKFHPVDRRNREAYFKGAKNIYILDNDDVYDFLYKVDILITDYSSVFFDYLLLDRPIIFSPFDYEEYERIRGFYYPYYDNCITPGPKAKDWNEIINYMKLIFRGEDEYKSFRKISRDSFNTYNDFNSSDRVFREILKINNKE